MAAGAVIFADRPIYTLVIPFLTVYLSFNVFLYGGLYILNDIADLESDKKHPKKKNRPLPSGRIDVASACKLSIFFIIIGLSIAYFYLDVEIFLMYLLFVFVNQFYTYTAKKIPYLEILFNSLTYSMRFFLGVLLVSSAVPYLLLLSVALLHFGGACVRRIIERGSAGWEARKVLRHYTLKQLKIFQIAVFCLILAILLIDSPPYLKWHIVVAFAYLVFVFGIYFSKNLVKFYQWLFLN